MRIDLRELHTGAVMEIRSPVSIPQVNFPPGFFADIQNDYRGSSPYHVNYCGYQQCLPGHCAGPFARTSYLVHVVRKGSGTYRVGSKTFHLHTGQLFLIYPGDTTTYIADRSDPWEYGWVGFSGDRVPQLLERIGFTKDMPILSVERCDTLMACILRMMDAHKMTLSDELLRTSELMRFFACILEGLESENSTAHIYSKETYAHVALRYLNDNYMYKIRISELASIIGVERSYLSRVFMGEYHQSPQQYLLRLRMDKACEMLEKTPFSVSEIASGVGYEDARSFTKLFRREYGMSPSLYRKQHSLAKSSRS